MNFVAGNKNIPGKRVNKKHCLYHKFKCKYILLYTFRGQVSARKGRKHPEINRGSAV